MAAKQKVVGEINPVVMDEVLERGDGKTIRLVFDLSKIQEDAGQYAKRLMFSRKIPLDTNTIAPTDPMIRVIQEAMPWEDKRNIIPTVRNYYDDKSSDAYRDAIMLAICASKENVFTEPPQPYTDASDTLPGIDALPEVVRNLTNPVEARLKQIMDFFSDDISAFQRFSQIFEDAILKTNALIGKAEKTDQNGFQSKRAN